MREYMTGSPSQNNLSKVHKHRTLTFCALPDEKWVKLLAEFDKVMYGGKKGAIRQKSNTLNFDNFDHKMHLLNLIERKVGGLMEPSWGHLKGSKIIITST